MNKSVVILILAAFTIILTGVTRRSYPYPQESTTVSDTIMADETFNLAARYSNIGKYDSSILCYTQAAALYKSSGLFEQQVNCLLKICELYFAIGALTQARTIAEEVLNVSVEHSITHEIGTSYNLVGMYYYYNSKMDSALLYLNKALDFWSETGDSEHEDMMDAYANKASILISLNEFEESLYLILKAISITQKLKSEDHDKLVYFYNIIGTLYNKKGHYQRAIEYYKKALDIWVPRYGDNNPLAGVLYNNIATCYQEEGNLDQALTFLVKAITSYELLIGPNDIRIAYFLNNLGNVRCKLTDYSGAFHDLRRALNIYSMHSGTGDKVSLVQNSIAKIYENLEKADSAIYFFNLAIKTMSEFDPNSREIAVYKSNLGNLLTREGEYDRAIDLYNQALKIAYGSFGEKHPRTAIFYNNIGETYYKKGDPGRALEYFQKSLIANLMEFEDTIPGHNPIGLTPLSRELFIHALIPKASIFYSYYQQQPDSLHFLKTALETVNIAIGMLDAMRTRLRSREVEVFADKQLLRAYVDGITYAYALYRKTKLNDYLEQAFSYSERKRSAVLYSLITELEARIIGGIPEKLQELEKSLYLDMIFYEKQIQDAFQSSNPEEDQLSYWQDLHFRLNRSYDSLINSFETEYPEYYRLKFDIRIAGINDVQKGMGENDVLIEYAFGDKLFTFVITKDTVTLIDSSVEDRFADQIERFREMLLSKDVSDHSITKYRKIASTLYSKLIKPIEPLIQEKSLIIIPDEELATISFEPLITDEEVTEISGFNSMPYLVKEHPIGYGFSATLFLHALKMRKRSWKADILAFAPSFSTNNEMLVAELQTRDERLIALEGAHEEVQNIHELFGGSLFTDTSATKKNFLEYSPEFNILHISTHGIMNDVKPMESRLIFFQDNDSTDEASLYAYELYSLQLPASLVVLSACNTGYGKLVAGEGVMSLARGFMYAGVPSILSTLWNVNDQSTSKIMTSFYKYLKDREPVTKALQEAQIDYLSIADNITAHPFYWSGFVLTGSNQPVLRTLSYRFYLMLAGVIIILIIIIISSLKRRLDHKKKP